MDGSGCVGRWPLDNILRKKKKQRRIVSEQNKYGREQNCTGVGWARGFPTDVNATPSCLTWTKQRGLLFVSGCNETKSVRQLFVNVHGRCTFKHPSWCCWQTKLNLLLSLKLNHRFVCLLVD